MFESEVEMVMWAQSTLFIPQCLELRSVFWLLRLPQELNVTGRQSLQHFLEYCFVFIFQSKTPGNLRENV